MVVIDRRLGGSTCTGIGNIHASNAQGISGSLCYDDCYLASFNFSPF